MLSIPSISSVKVFAFLKNSKWSANICSYIFCLSMACSVGALKLWKSFHPTKYKNNENDWLVLPKKY